MAKLALLVATFALALFVVNASIYRQQHSCQQQIREEDNLRDCQRYIEDESSNRYHRSDRHLDSCCQQLENLQRDCRCDGLEQAVRQQMKDGEWEREEAQQLYKVAEKILQRCDNVEEPRRCDLPSRRWF